MASLSREFSLNIVLEEKAKPDGAFKKLDEIYQRNEVKCVQSVNEKTWCVTVVNAHAAEKLQREDVVINKKLVAVTPAGRKITFVNVFGAPQELSDAAVTSKLSFFGSILSHRRGHWQSHPEWENGVRHYRMELTHAIPSFVKIGQFSLHIKYDGQLKTCRKCSGQEHMASFCPYDTCYNCGLPGHRAAQCPNPPKCKICGEQHATRDCPQSYRNQTRKTPATMSFPPAEPQQSASDCSDSEQVEDIPTTSAERVFPQLTNTSEDESTKPKPKRPRNKPARKTPNRAQPQPDPTNKRATTGMTKDTTTNSTPKDWADRSERPTGGVDVVLEEKSNPDGFFKNGGITGDTAASHPSAPFAAQRNTSTGIATATTETWQDGRP